MTSPPTPLPPSSTPDAPSGPQPAASLFAGGGARPLIGERYEIQRVLAEGGMGVIYVARHVVTLQTVALKVLDRQFARDEASVQRFVREVTFAGRIRHPGIVKVYDAGVHASPEGPRPFLAMELLSGENFAQRLARGAPTASFAMDVIARTLEPLAVAHTAGIIHRDLKPENVFLEHTPEGTARVRLIDFGIARSNDDLAATRTGSALGTVYYMPPEQTLDARRVTTASDVYAVGAMMYQILAGRFPFDGETPGAILIRAFNEPHAPLATLCPGIDPRLSALVDRCLSKLAQDRPPDARALFDALAPLLADRSIRAWLDARTVVPDTFRDATASAVQPRDAPTRPSLPMPLEAPTLKTAEPSTAPAKPAPTRRLAVAAVVFCACVLALTLGLWFTPRAPQTVATGARPTATRVSSTPAPAPAPPVVATPAPPPAAAAPTPTITPAPPTEPATPAVEAPRRTSVRTRRTETTAQTHAPTAPTTAPVTPIAPASPPPTVTLTVPSLPTAPATQTPTAQPPTPPRPAARPQEPAPPPFVTF